MSGQASTWQASTRLASIGLAGDYAAAGFASRIGWGSSPALVVVDAAVAYSDPSSPLYLAGADAALDAMADLVAAAREGGRPVVFTTVRLEAGGWEARHFVAKVPALKVFDPSNPLCGWPERISPGPSDRVIVKHFASAFFGTDLASGLTAGGVDTVVVAGFSTSGCVRATAVDALQHGFRPMVVEQAVADRDPGPHRANLFDLDAKYADVVDLAEAVEHLGTCG